MTELTREAGLAEPEFESNSGQVLVRFRPTRYSPPMRVGHDLSPLQRELLDILAQRGATSLREIRATLAMEAARRTVQDNLVILRHLNLVETTGSGWSARWRLKGPES